MPYMFRALFFCWALALVAVPEGARAVEKISNYSGTVTATKQGVLYLRGVPHEIVLVATADGDIQVAVPTSSMQPTQIGEQIAFFGPVVKVLDQSVINTLDGAIWRHNEKSMARAMAEQMAAMQALQKSQDATALAVPIVTVETKIQKQEKEDSERAAALRWRIDLSLAILSLILAVLAFRWRPGIIDRVAKRVFLSFRKRITSVRRSFGRG